MKKLLLTSAAVLAVFSSAANAADITPYASVKAVMSMTNMDHKTEGDSSDFTNYGADIAIGAKTGAVRAELAYAYLAKDNDTSDDIKWKTSAQSFMLNGYFDIDNPTVFKPYVGAGVGMAKVKTKASFINENDEPVSDSISKNKFAYSLMAGVGAEVAKNVTVDVGYRYTDYGTMSKDGYKHDTKAHQILAGVRYSF